MVTRTVKVQEATSAVSEVISRRKDEYQSQNGAWRRMDQEWTK